MGSDSLLIDDGDDPDLHDPLVRLLRPSEDAARLEGPHYEEIHLDDDPAFRQRLLDLTGGWTVPQFLIDDRPIGGSPSSGASSATAALDELLAA